jgi:steroid 5-alpha reductase family enzyme
MVILWLVSLLLKNSSIVDMFWGMGFVMSVWIVFFQTWSTVTPRHWVIAIRVTIWGLRLSLHVFIRNAGKGEDFRYAKWRQEHGKNWWWYSLIQTFLLQGLLMWMIAAPLTAAQLSPQTPTLNLLDIIAVLLWLLGFTFESLGDLQLARFKANPNNKGKLLNTGVWHYTRHPNYFGDATQWWAFFLIATAAGGYWTIFSPILMTFFLIKVSGVAMLEKTLQESKPGYKEYMAQTNAFIPWFPKK